MSNKKMLRQFVAWFLLISPAFGARHFNGTTDVITVSGSGTAVDISSAELTLACWVKPSASSTSAGNFGAYLIDKYGLNNTKRQYGLAILDQGDYGSGALSGAAGDGGSNWYVTTHCNSLVANSWQHVIFDYESDIPGGHGYSAYNGSLCQTVGTGGSHTTASNGQNLKLGNSAGQTMPNFDLAQCAIWTSTLNVLEWTALASGTPPNYVHSSTLVGYFQLLGSTSPEPDLGGHALNGTLTGTSRGSSDPAMIQPPK
jgi:hypothetical protein